MTALPALLIAAVGLDLFGNAAGLELTYAGRMTPVAVAEGDAAEKGFKVSWTLQDSKGDDADALFLLTEDAAAQPWPARFGFCSPSRPDDAGPQIGYRFDDRDHTVPLPGMISLHADRLATEREVVDGPMRYTVTGEKEVQGRDCLIVETSTNFGRETVSAVDKSTGMIVTWEQPVVLGRGDRFLLSLELTKSVSFDAPRAERRRAIADALREIAKIVGQGDRDAAADLPGESIKVLSDHLKSLTGLVKDTSFESFAAAIARNVDEQRTRADGIAGLTEKIVGSPAPALDLKGLDGKPIDAALLDGKVVILHFWEYDRAELAPPYGQVGYLDFLHRRRAEEGVSVIGVATNPAFGIPEARGKAVRSAKGLVEFMNLGYPVAADDGSLLRRFGDTRPLGARLPLWVVIDAEGIVRGFNSGLYDVQPNDGLKELDANAVELTKRRNK
ncbi:MAG: TlpA disulfide reductase family protein [Planctomycetaceae bacterium]